MKTLHFSQEIIAPADIVWETMLDDATYREWTSAFSPGSYFEGSWLQGSEIRFLGDSDDDDGTDSGSDGGSDGDGMGGLVGVIAEHRPHEFVSIEYTGLILNGDVDTESDYAKKFIGTHENYTFSESRGVTTLTIDLDVDEEEADMFAEMWPKGLDRLTELAEAEAATHGRHAAGQPD
ncbi:hypothetical protein BJQ94_18770 [Cryobacterium sp. SO2]|uniref:hypothetical protein n=1 Tax=Cryobacterium sp. SO2 TaxID=1897060 RepID=UPI00223E111D|nr:hypothetical protein [Cryobacterium sp. SO2]WEO77366.1 hypothetical protein BJQ94_18770 [Cryobacterium sp. SO2]